MRALKIKKVEDYRALLTLRTIVKQNLRLSVREMSGAFRVSSL